MIAYKTGEFAEMAGVHIRTVQKWDKDGYLVAYRTPAGHRYYTEDHIRALEELKHQKTKTEKVHNGHFCKREDG